MKGFGSFPFAWQCLLAYTLYIHVCLSRLGFAMLCTLHGLMLVGLWGHLLMWLHLSLLWIVWMLPFMGYTSMVLACLIYTFLCSVRCCYACLACFVPPIWLFFASLHACLHVYAWVCVSSILQSNGTMDTQFKPTFVLLGHPLLFDNMFVCPCLTLPLIACLLACFPSICFFACLLACFFWYCMYMGHGHLEQRYDLLGASKRARMQARRCKPTMGNA